MSFRILSDVSKQYLLEEDAIVGFRAAVENGQSRLALQILTDIIDAFMEIFVEAFEESAEQQEQESALAVAPAPEKQAPVVSEEKSDVAEDKPKQTSKKEPKAAE